MGQESCLRYWRRGLERCNRQDADRFKTLISGTKLRINEKHQPEYEIENHIGFVFLSNHDDAIHLVTEDRRFFVVEVSAGRKSDAFYGQFVDWRDRGDTQLCTIT